MSSFESVGREAISATAAFGRAYSIFSAVLATVISAVLLYVGTTILKEQKRMVSVIGTISANSNCTSQSTSSGQNTQCTSFVTYTVGSKTFANTPMDTGTVQYITGASVKVWYDPSTPDVPVASIPSKTVGLILLGTALLVLVASWGWVVVAHYSKAGAIFGLFRK